MAANAALLDELMGRNRNMNPEEQKLNAVHFDHPDVCKYYLCSFCPHELFKNTRVDIGPCEKIHEDALVTEYKSSSRYKKMNYEEDFNKFVGGLVSDIDKRIKRGHARLQLNMANNDQEASEAKSSEISKLTETINEQLKKAEELGCEGKVDESQQVLQKIEDLKQQRTTLEQQELNMPDLKEMEVCGVCGAFQVKGDAPQRVEEHINGKQHLGYAKLRSYLQDVDDERKEREEEERKARDERRKDDRYSDRSSNRDRDRRNDDRHDRRRDERRRSRSRDRDRRSDRYYESSSSRRHRDDRDRYRDDRRYSSRNGSYYR